NDLHGCLAVQDFSVDADSALAERFGQAEQSFAFFVDECLADRFMVAERKANDPREFWHNIDEFDGCTVLLSYERSLLNDRMDIQTRVGRNQNVLEVQHCGIPKSSRELGI